MFVEMDSSWIELPNDHPDYLDGVVKFIELAKENLVEGRTRCPCRRCKVDKWLPIEEVEQHILFKGFHKEYKDFFFHGQVDILDRVKRKGSTSQEINDNPSKLVGKDNMDGLLRAAFGVDIHRSADDTIPNVVDELLDEGVEPCDVYDEQIPGGQFFESPNQSFDNEEKVKYNKLLQAANEALYDGCTSFSKLSFLLHLFHMKCMFHWSAESFTMLIKLLGEAFPQIMEFPSSYYEAKKMVNSLGLGYEKIDACPNDCILYWGESSEKDRCHVCGVSRWKTVKGKERQTSEENANVKVGEPAKAMRYFPLIPRLRRIYMSPKSAEHMRWHDRDRVKDGKLRHPADAIAWREFHALYADFAFDPRDGFNPYRLMNTTYSIWPIVLIPYNLPLWLCMKSM